LSRDLHPLAAQWRTLGTQLNFSGAEQNEIEGEKNRCQHCLEKVLQRWLEESEGPHKKSDLVTALKSPSVGQIGLANSISENSAIKEDLDANKESVKILSEELSKVAHKYKDLGIQLLDDFRKIKQIESTVKDVQSYLTEILERWWGRYNDEPPLSELLEAIKSNAIGNKALAIRLEKEWQKNGFLPAPEADGNNKDEEIDIQKDV
jgi:hypothetical protein